jgi:hypothetical protein
MWKVCAAIAALGVSILVPPSDGRAGEAASPIYGVTIPAGYRQWQAVAPSEEAGQLNEIRIIFGNAIAMKASSEGRGPSPTARSL